MSRESMNPLRIAVVGGGPAGSLFALYALEYARQAGREIAVTIYEGKDFRQFGPSGCNMCAGIVPVSVLRDFDELGIAIPPELILSRIRSYSLHTSAGSLDTPRPEALAEIISVYRGAGPRHGHPPDLVSFDELLLEKAVQRGARLCRAYVQAIRRSRPVEILSAGEREPYDLVVLAAGVNGRSITLDGFDYQPPPTSPMCQTEVYLGLDEVQHRLGSSVHIFLPPDDIATYGVLVPKGPFVAVSLLNPRHQIASLCRFLDLDEVKTVLGASLRRVCGCLPRISVGPARNVIEDGFVAIGDASATRLYKNGIGSALATARRAAWTAISVGCRKDDFRTNYLPLCRAIESDNRIGRLLFLEVPMLKRFGLVPMAHYRIATRAQRYGVVSDLHTRILWGMFTGAYPYRDLFRMAMNPSLVAQLALAFGHAAFERREHPSPAVR